MTWEPRHIAAALRWANMGMPYVHIASMLGRTPRAVKHKLYRERNE